jgi:hypothetical protein
MGKDCNCETFSCFSDLEDKIQDVRNDFLFHSKTKMMLLISDTANDMIRFVSMYPKVWFLDCTAGECENRNTFPTFYIQMCHTNLYVSALSTNRQTKELFVMAVHSASGDTLPRNLTIIPSAQKWVFHAIYQYACSNLYSSEVCS